MTGRGRRLGTWVGFFLVGFVCAAVLDFVIWQPRRERRQERAQEKLESTMIRLQESTAASRKQEEFLVEFDRLHVELEKLAQLAPAWIEETTASRVVGGAIAESGVQVERLEWTEPVEREFYFEVPFEGVVLGALHQILDFSESVERSRLRTAVRRLAIYPSAEDPRLEGSFEAYFLTIPEEGEEPEPFPEPGPDLESDPVPLTTAAG